MADHRVLVPVERTQTLRATVMDVVEEAAEADWNGLHFVYVAPWRDGDPNVDRQRRSADELLERVAQWAESDSEELGANVAVTTAMIGTDEYLFGPDQYAACVSDYAHDNGIDEVVIDPGYAPVGNATLLQPLKFDLSEGGLSVREATVDRPSSRERLAKEVTGARFAGVFGVSLLFYFVLGDPTYWFDVVTGVASALLVAIALSNVSLDHDPSLDETPGRVVRGVIYIPVLLWEILKANLVVAKVILSPSLPIQPRMTRMRVLVGRGLPVTTLANSITLTPGTLTVRAKDENLYVHALIPWAREGLFEGSLERWTRFVFYGRDAAQVATPAERMDCAVLQGSEADEPLPIGTRTDGGVAFGRRSDADPVDEADEAEVTDE